MWLSASCAVPLELLGLLLDGRLKHMNDITRVHDLHAELLPPSRFGFHLGTSCGKKVSSNYLVSKHSRWIPHLLKSSLNAFTLHFSQVFSPSKHLAIQGETSST